MLILFAESSNEKHGRFLKNQSPYFTKFLLVNPGFDPPPSCQLMIC